MNLINPRPVFLTKPLTLTLFFFITFVSTTTSVANPTPANNAPQEEFLFAKDSNLLLKVVGRSDNIAIEIDSSTNTLSPTSQPAASGDVPLVMDPLRPYFVVADAGEHYHISSTQGESGVRGFVLKNDVVSWNTREGLHFVDDTFRRDRRASVAAWESEDRIRNFIETSDFEIHGPTFKEELQTRIGNRGIIPYPLLDTQQIKTESGEIRRIHEVLIPAIVSGKVETNLTPEETLAVAGAVTICVIFDATASMEDYAEEFANTVDHLLERLSTKIDMSRSAAGFVLFRDVKDASRFEIAHPMPLDDATGWLRQRIERMIGGNDPEEPVLDAITLAQNSFLWNGGTATRGATRIAILIANEGAKPKTISLSKQVPPGLDAESVAQLMKQNGIRTFALQAGREDAGNLYDVLSTVADITGGEYFSPGLGDDAIGTAFATNLEKIITAPIQTNAETAAALESNISLNAGGGTVIPLNVLDERVAKRLQDAADDFHISSGGLAITRAWVLEEPDLYREKILVEKELLEWLVRFFGQLTDSTLNIEDLQDTTANILEAFIGEEFAEDVELQELLEKRLGIHFTTNILSFELELLSRMGPKELTLLQDNIRNASSALADFLEMNTVRFSEETRIWMPVSYLP